MKKTIRVERTIGETKKIVPVGSIEQFKDENGNNRYKTTSIECKKTIDFWTREAAIFWLCYPLKETK